MAHQAIRIRSGRSQRIISLFTLLVLSGCSTVHLMPPRDLVRGAAMGDTTRSPVAGHWHSFSGFRDRWGEDHRVTGRVRTLPPDSLEFHLGSSWSMNLLRASIVPRDSIRFLRIVEHDSQAGGGIVLAIVVGAAVAYVAVLATIGSMFRAVGRLGSAR